MPKIEVEFTCILCQRKQTITYSEPINWKNLEEVAGHLDRLTCRDCSDHLNWHQGGDDD